MFHLVLAVSLVALQGHAPTNGGLPSVSPDGRLIAFLSERTGSAEIFVMGPDGSGVVQLTRSMGRIGAPGWSRDGKRVLFSVMPSRDSSTLYSVLPTGEGLTKIGTWPGFQTALAPDQRRVGLTLGTRPNTHFVMADLDGSHPDTLVRGPGMVINPTWSPDGKQIAYAFMDTTRTMRMWVMKHDGTGRRRIAQSSDSGSNDQWPTWSPDGKRIAVQGGVYARQPPWGGTAHIWVIDLAAGKATKLGAHDKAYLDETPSWFPDGKRIAFQSDRTGRMEVWAMNADGTGAVQLTQGAMTQAQATPAPAVAPAPAAPGDPITGMWDGAMGPPDTPKMMPIMMHLTFDGSAVTGTVEGTPAMGTVERGTFDAKTGVLKLTVVVPGEDAKGEFEGTVKDGVIRGKVIIGTQAGTFELTKKAM